MKVKELIAVLQKVDPEASVHLSDDAAYQEPDTRVDAGPTFCAESVTGLGSEVDEVAVLRVGEAPWVVLKCEDTANVRT